MTNQAVDIAQVIGERADVETFAVRLPSAPQIDGVDGEAQRDELLGDPPVVTAV